MKFLQLGTALWAWTIEQDMAFQLLDRFYELGHRHVDCATNYPINKNPADFRKAEQFLETWIHAHGVQDLKITQKVGSVHNLGTPENLLTPSFLELNLQQYRARFGSNLHTLMIHWDNRAEAGAIRESLEALASVRHAGLHLGLSGIRHPELYAEQADWLGEAFYIQCKHNLLESAYPHYRVFHGKPRFVAYGINAGGLRFSADYQEKSSIQLRGGMKPGTEQMLAKLQALVDAQAQDTERPLLRSVNQLGMLFAWGHPDFCGILIGPSNPRQLEQSLICWQQFLHFDYSDLYHQLASIT